MLYPAELRARGPMNIGLMGRFLNRSRAREQPLCAILMRRLVRSPGRERRRRQPPRRAGELTFRPRSAINPPDFDPRPVLTRCCCSEALRRLARIRVSSGSIRMKCRGRTTVEKAREAHLSTEQARPQASARLPRPDGDKRRPQGHCCTSCTRPEASFSLILSAIAPLQRRYRAGKFPAKISSAP